MGLTMRTALEMFTNPGDLLILIGQERGNEKFAIAISRGPEAGFRGLLTSHPFAETQEEAIGYIREILELVSRVAREAFADDKGILSQYLNPDGEEIDESKVPNQELIERILTEITQHKTAETFKMLSPAG